MDSPTSAEGGHVNSRMRYNGCVPREATFTKAGRLKAGSRDGLAMPVPKAWKASRASSGPGRAPIGP